MPHPAGPIDAPVPAVLRLVQRSVLGRWRATGEELYREVARLTELARGREAIVVGSGDGTTPEWLARRTGAAIVGVDASRARVERAEERGRALGLPVQYEHAPLDDLPHEDGVFDVAIGQPAMSAAADVERAVAELARVTKPMGVVVLLQLTWSSDIPTEARDGVVERLGLRPFLLVEWKQMLRDAGVVDLQVQDWTTGGSASGDVEALPPLTWRDKMQIVGRAWARWGWREARGAVARETALLRELTRERALGFTLLWGVKWPHAASD